VGRGPFGGIGNRAKPNTGKARMPKKIDEKCQAKQILRRPLRGGDKKSRRGKHLSNALREPGARAED